MDLNERVKAQDAAHAGLSLSPGQHVIDAVSGELATIDSGSLMHPAQVPKSLLTTRGLTQARGAGNNARVECYILRYADGSVDARTREQLHPIPAFDRVDLEDFA